MSKKILLSLDELLYKKIKTESNYYNISVTHYINDVLTEYFNQQKLQKETEELKNDIEHLNILTEKYSNQVIFFTRLLDDVTKIK